MADIIGHKKNIEFLKKSIQNKKISHAYFFYGPSHIEKSSVVELFSSMLLCENKSFCKKCKNCKHVLNGSHPDLLWLKEPEEMKIDRLRKVVKFFNLSSFSDSYKIVIIENAHNLNISSANSILKFLEEPPVETIIIFISNSFYDIPATVRSRCQVLRFSSPSKEEIKNGLKKTFKLKEKAIDEMIYLAMNRLRIVNEFAANPATINIFKNKINKIINFLDSNKRENKYQLFNYSSKTAIDDLNNLLIVIRFLILSKLNNSLINESILSNNLKKVSAKYTIKKLTTILDLIIRTRSWIEGNTNKKLAIANILINL